MYTPPPPQQLFLASAHGKEQKMLVISRASLSIWMSANCYNGQRNRGDTETDAATQRQYSI